MFVLIPERVPFMPPEGITPEDDEPGGIFNVLSDWLFAAVSGDQPLCLFLGGPAFT